MIINQLFSAANLFVLPFWVLMIFLPNWGVTRRVMDSLLPFAALAALYLYLLATAITPESAQALSNPQLQPADLVKLFSSETAVTAGWVHFLVFDLFVGRWIYWQGQRTGVWTAHSLLLCLLAGPSGLLSHILTRWITQRFTNQTLDTEAVADT